jgi:FMN phosphatase YigB (HAD superfamily)
VLAVAADGGRQLLAGCLVGPGAPAPHALVADPSEGATYQDLAADLGGGRAVGAATVLVRGGKGDRPRPGAEAEPDAVVDSVADLPGLLQG